MDDDLQHPLDVLPLLVDSISQGYDLVFAVNRDRSRHSILRMGTYLNGLFFSLFLKKPRAVEIGSYRIMTRNLVEKIGSQKRDFIYVSAMIFKNVQNLRVHSFRYNPDETTIPTGSRFSFRKRVVLFLKLFINYGPLSSLHINTGIPYEIEAAL